MDQALLGSGDALMSKVGSAFRHPSVTGECLLSSPPEAHSAWHVTCWEDSESTWEAP